MIVRHFLHWVRTASAGQRAEATSALARAYLISDLSRDDRAAVEGAMMMLLDDLSPLVRRTLAEVLAASDEAPPELIYALANDVPDIAVIVLERSPLFIDADLVDMVAVGAEEVQVAIARRPQLPRSVAAAVAEVGSAEACLALIENPDVELALFSLDRIVERFGQLAEIRETLLARGDLPVSTRQALMIKLSQTLADFVTSRDWIDRERVRRVAREACEKGTVVLAAETHQGEMRPLIRHLRATGQLNAGLVLRALLSGNDALFEEALSDLSGLPLDRVSSLVHDKGAAAFRALYDKAGLPASTWPAFREAVDALREAMHLEEPGGPSQLKRRMIERVLTRCGDAMLGEVEPFMALLRRFATEAAREEARRYCEELVADVPIARPPATYAEMHVYADERAAA
jgi:uncharacterized protein (DUF2336 family)